jgi:hypothetical protein
VAGQITMIKRAEPSRVYTQEEISEWIQNLNRPAVLPEEPPAQIDFATFRNDDLWVCHGLNIDIASQGDTADEAEANFREAVLLYYCDREEASLQQEPLAEFRLGSLVHA